MISPSWSLRFIRQSEGLPTIYRTAVLVIVLLVGGLSEARAYPPLEFGVRQSSAALFHLDYNGDSTADRIVGYGAPSDIGLVGDFDGDTITDFAVYRDGFWYLDYFNDTIANAIVIFGGSATTDTPIVGDFNNDGRADIGIYRNNGVWYLDYNLNGAPDHISGFGGLAGDLPVVGDFNGDGNTDRAIFRQGQWFIDTNWDGVVDAIHFFGGLAADLPLAADFNLDGVADLVIFRNGTWFIDYNRDTVPDRIHLYGAAGMRPVVGYFNTANSLFVRAGASGAQNGQQSTPFATINAALLSNPPSGSIIRIAAGVYAERVSISQKSNLTFQGVLQGVNPMGTFLNPAAGDAFSCFLSSNITLRDLRIASNGPDGTTPGRGVVNLGSSLTLEHVAAIGSRNTNLIAVEHFPGGGGGSLATLTVDRSRMDASQIANGVQLENGVTATIRRTTVNGNGTNPAAMPPPPAAPGGRGIVLFGNANVTVEMMSSVSNNHDGGLLGTQTATAVLRNSTFNGNGTNGIYLEALTTGSIMGNTINQNGTRGTRGAGGFNGIEIAATGAPMTISNNTISNNTANAIYLGDGAISVLNNTMFNNWVGITIDNSANRPMNITVRGNTFELPAGAPFSAGMFLDSTTGASLAVTIGGAATADKNTFRNYGSFPGIFCNLNTINAQCVMGGNIFINCSAPVQNCPACSP